MQQFWIANTITDITEKSCFISLMFQMQPMNQIVYRKVGTSMTGVGVPRNWLPMVWKHPGGFYVNP